MSSPEAKPMLSVVIPTMGRPILIRTLHSLMATPSFPRLEVWVAGRAPPGPVEDELRRLCAEHPNIRHLPVQYEKGDSSLKKNAGAREARADFVAFLDDDVVVAPDWPEQILAPFADPRVGLVSGPSLVPRDINRIGRYAGLALASRAAGYVMFRYRREHPEAIPRKWSQIIGCNAAYRREAFQAMGTFDPTFYPGEEMIASFRTQQLGWHLRFAPAAYVYHYPRQSLWRFWKQIWGYGATRIRLLRAGVEWEWSPMAPGAWAASLFLLGLAAIWWPFARWLLLANLAAYGLLTAFFTFEILRESRQWRDAGVALLIPFMHVSYGLAQWAELFRPGRDFSEKGPSVTARPG